MGVGGGGPEAPPPDGQPGGGQPPGQPPGGQGQGWAPPPGAQGAPPQGAPPQGAPSQGWPPQGAPPQGAPPPQGWGAPGAPPQGAPPQGWGAPGGGPPQGWGPQGGPPQGWGPHGGPPGGLDPAEAVGRRIGAALIDFVILFVVFIVIGILMGEGESGDGNASITFEGAETLVLFLIWMAYYIATEAAWGATVGKRALGLVVRSADGTDPSFGQIVGRNLLRIVDSLPFLYIVGLITMLVTQRKQRVGDLAASTIVVQRQP